MGMLAMGSYLTIEREDGKATRDAISTLETKVAVAEMRISMLELERQRDRDDRHASQ
jgi:hypothetical protein